MIHNLHPQEESLGFYPVSEHLRLLDPEVVLAVGPQGSGKTRIARALGNPFLVQAMARYAPCVQLPPKSSEWMAVCSHEASPFDDLAGLEAYVKREWDLPDSMRDLWFACLLRMLANRLDIHDRERLLKLILLPSSDVDAIVDEFRRLGTAPVVALDRLDHRLCQDGKCLFLTFDGLDSLGGGNQSITGACVCGLVAFWATYSRRWRCIRAKIFLRTDLYDQHARAGGADLGKMAAGRIELVWNRHDLYGLLLKYLANANGDLGRRVREANGVDWIEDEVLGFVPRLRKWQDARKVLTQVANAHENGRLASLVHDVRSISSPGTLVRLIKEKA